MKSVVRPAVRSAVKTPVRAKEVIEPPATENVTNGGENVTNSGVQVTNTE